MRIPLSAKEYDILVYLTKNEGKSFLLASSSKTKFLGIQSLLICVINLEKLDSQLFVLRITNSVIPHFFQ